MGAPLLRFFARAGGIDACTVSVLCPAACTVVTAPITCTLASALYHLLLLSPLALLYTARRRDRFLIRAGSRFPLGPCRVIETLVQPFVVPALRKVREERGTRAPNSAERNPHINYWDYTSGKRGAGGISGAVPIPPED